MTRFNQGPRWWRRSALLPALVLVIGACGGTAATVAPSEAASSAVGFRGPGGHDRR